MRVRCRGREVRAWSLKKGRVFFIRYSNSLKKHNEQYASADLLFLAAFSEATTGRMVARLLVGEETFADPPDAIKTFESPIHARTIDLEKFGCFLKDVCFANSVAAAETENFKLVAATVKLIADGRNIWDGSKELSERRKFYLLHFGSLPSTSEMVEQAIRSGCEMAPDVMYALVNNAAAMKGLDLEGYENQMMSLANIARFEDQRQTIEGSSYQAD